MTFALATAPLTVASAANLLDILQPKPVQGLAQALSTPAHPQSQTAVASLLR